MNKTQQGSSPVKNLVLLLVLGSGLAISVFLQRLAEEEEMQQAQNQAIQTARQIAVSLASAANDRLVVLRNLRSVVEQHGYDEILLERLAEEFLAQYPDINRIEWSERIAGVDVITAGATGLIYDYKSALEMVPAPPREQYYPITQIVPDAAEGATLGMDILSVPHWRDVINRAREARQPAATAATALPSQQTVPKKIRIFLAVQTESDEASQPLGYVSMVIALRPFLSQNLQAFANAGLALDVFDLGQQSKQPIFRWNTEPGDNRVQLKGTDVHQERVPFADRRWLLRTQPHKTELDSWRTSNPAMILSLGVMLTMSVCATILYRRD